MQAQLWVLLTQTGQQAFGRIDFAILFLLAIAVAHFFHIEGNTRCEPALTNVADTTV